MITVKDPNLFYTDKILNLGHRGASHHAPENTLAAFRLAVEMGANGVEFDVQLSKDGHVIIIHDYLLNKTTNGQGPVKNKTLTDLKSLDAGGYFSSEFKGATIPTLEEVFISLGPILLFNVELKTAALRDEGLEAEVIRLIEDYNLQDRVILSSFNPFSLMRAHRVNAKIKRGLLWRANLPLYLRGQWFRTLAKPDMFHPFWEDTTTKMIQNEHKQGRLVNVWTCNESETMLNLIGMGVNAIMTDYPDRLKQVIDESAAL